MSKGSIFLQYLCKLLHFYRLGRINNKLIPEDCITHTTYQTFEYSITHRLYRQSNPHPEKFSKFAPPDALKILIHSLVLPVFCFLCKKFSKLLKSTLQNTLF